MDALQQPDLQINHIHMRYPDVDALGFLFAAVFRKKRPDEQVPIP